ncbi:hypothetical protein THAOC_19431, partial [Thalassiosira oceanica]
KYLADPLGMHNTSFDCPNVASTNEKPHLAWGLCSTGHDFAKVVQMLIMEGMGPDGTRVLSKYGVRQIFSNGGGKATMRDSVLNRPRNPTGSYLVSRCYPRMDMEKYDGIPFTLPTGPWPDYGLGAMFFLGNQGEIFGHLGALGGVWFVAPGRFSYYLAWAAFNMFKTYQATTDILNAFESASNFTVTSTDGGEEHWEEIPVCGGEMYEDLFEHLGIDSMKKLLDYLDPSTPRSCDEDIGLGERMLWNEAVVDEIPDYMMLL